MIIYKITNLINNKVYIGQTIRLLRSRIIQHLNCVKNKQNYPLYHSINKYGWNNFKVDIIDIVSDITILNSKEIYWIRKLNSIFPNGYNLTYGGKNYISSEEHKHRLSLANKGNKKPPRSKEHIKNLSIAHIGKHHTEETRRKLSITHKGRVVTKETRKKISKANKGKKLSKITKRRISIAKKNISDETRLKLSLANKGQIPWIKGKHHSVKTKEKISKSEKGKIISEETKRKMSLAKKNYWRKNCVRTSRQKRG